MEFSGQQIIPAPRTLVWQQLNDMGVIQSCIAGCETINALGDDKHELVMVAAVGPVKAKFKGKLAISEKVENSGYTLAGEGNGGVAGFGKMTAKVTLTDAPDGATQLDYHADASVGGKLAQIGSRLVQAAANKFADDFFKKFNAVVGAGAAAEVVTEVAVAEPAPVIAPEAMSSKSEAQSASSGTSSQEGWWGRLMRWLGGK